MLAALGSASSTFLDGNSEHLVNHTPKGRTSVAERGPDRPRSSAGAAGDFDSIFRDHFASMVRLAHLLGSDDPENAAQEAFSRLHARLSRLAEPERAVGYLRACLINITRARHAHFAVMARHPHTSDANVATAESTFQATADRAVIIAALSRLSPRHREALVLRYWLDLSKKQMAQAMGTSVVTGMTAILRFAGGADRTATLCALVTDTDHSNLASGSADLDGSTFGYLAMIRGAVPTLSAHSAAQQHR